MEVPISMDTHEDGDTDTSDVMVFSMPKLSEKHQMKFLRVSL